MLFNRGPPPAWQTKVVDNNLCPLKSGSSRLCVPVCDDDAVSSNPTLVGQVAAEVHTNNDVRFVFVVRYVVRLVNM